MSAIAFVLDKEARELSPIAYPNGAGMSVREAKKYGLYISGNALVPEYFKQLQEAALNGSKRDKAVFRAAKWNLSMLGNQMIFYIKSDLEGKVPVYTVAPAHVRNEDVYVPLTTIGDVLLDKVERLPKAKLSPINI